MKYDKKDNIHWCRSNPAKSNPMQLKRRAIGPAGQVVDISLANGKAQVQLIGNSYAQLIQHEKEHNRGWVWYYECKECPPAPAREKRTGKENWCEKCAAREALIDTRVSLKSAENAEYQELFESKMDKLAKVIEAKMVADVRPSISPEALVAAMNAEPPKKSGKGKATGG